MLILHLSDLYLGRRFRPLDVEGQGARMAQQILETARSRLNTSTRIDVVLVTGDTTWSGKPDEFGQSEIFFQAMAGELGLEPRRLVFTPGNHDVSWPLCQIEEMRQEVEGFDDAELRRRIDGAKLRPYREFLKRFYGEKSPTRALSRGARLHDFPELSLSVAALNSCERESHRPDDHVGHVSREQAQAVLDAWQADARASWLKILALHHDPTLSTFEGAEYLRAASEEVEAQMLFHNHGHESDTTAERRWHTTHLFSIGTPLLSSSRRLSEQDVAWRLIFLDTETSEVEDLKQARPFRLPLHLPAGFEPQATAYSEFEERSDAVTSFLRIYRSRFTNTFKWTYPFSRLDPGIATSNPEDMFIPPRLNPETSLTPETLRHRTRPILLLGDPGSGKTTWVLWKFNQLLREDELWPLLVLAHKWIAHEPSGLGRPPDLQRFFLEHVSQVLGDGWRDGMRRALAASRGPRPVLLIDGWDEMVPARRDELRQGVFDLMARYPRILVIVTSRPLGGVGPLRDAGFEVLEIQPFSEAQISEFVRQILSHTSIDEAGTHGIQQRFEAMLAHRFDLLQLAHNPLILTSMLILFLHRGGALPEARHRLYEECVDLLLRRWPALKSGREIFETLPGDPIAHKRALAYIAYEMQRGLDTSDLSSASVSREQLFNLLPDHWSASSRHTFLRALADHMGLLIETSPGVFSFLHRSFQQYLAAWYLNATVEGTEARVRAFQELIRFPDWDETLLLWVEMLQEQNEERLIPVLEALKEEASDREHPWIDAILTELYERHDRLRDDKAGLQESPTALPDVTDVRFGSTTNRLPREIHPFAREIPWGQGLLDRLRHDGAHVSQARPLDPGRFERWLLRIRLPPPLQKAYGTAPEVLLLAVRGEVSGGDLEEARSELYRGVFDLDLDLLLITDDQPDLAERLDQRFQLWGQWVPWLRQGETFDSLAEQLSRHLPTHDIFEERDPVRGRKVIGRNETVMELSRLLRQGQSIGVYGLRKVGKTTVVRAVTDRLDPVNAHLSGSVLRIPEPGVAEPSMLVVWLDVERMVLERSLEGAVGRLVRELERRLAATGLETGRAVLFGEPLTRLDALLETALEQTELPLCIVLDEYELLFGDESGQPAVPRIHDLLRLLRAHAQESARLRMVMIGRDGGLFAQPEIHGESNAMLGWFVPRHLSPLDQGGADELLGKLGRRVLLEVGPRTLALARRWTGGHPLLHRQFGSALWTLSRQRANVTEQHIATDPFCEEALTPFCEREAVMTICREVEHLLSTHYPAAHALFRDLCHGTETEARETLAAIHDDGSGHAARALYDFGLLQDTEHHTVPEVFRWYARSYAPRLARRRA